MRIIKAYKNAIEQQKQKLRQNSSRSYLFSIYKTKTILVSFKSLFKYFNNICEFEQMKANSKMI